MKKKSWKMFKTFFLLEKKAQRLLNMQICLQKLNNFRKCLSVSLFSPHYVVIYVLILATPLLNLLVIFCCSILPTLCVDLCFDPGSTIRQPTVLVLQYFVVISVSFL